MYEQEVESLVDDSIRQLKTFLHNYKLKEAPGGPTNCKLNTLYEDTTANEGQYMAELCKLNQRIQLDPWVLTRSDDLDRIDEDSSSDDQQDDPKCLEMEIEGCEVANSLSSHQDRCGLLEPIFEYGAKLVNHEKEISKAMDVIDLDMTYEWEPIPKFLPCEETWEPDCLIRIEEMAAKRLALLEFVDTIKAEVEKMDRERAHIAGWMETFVNIIDVYIDVDNQVGNVTFQKKPISLRTIEELANKMKTKIEENSRAESLCPFKLSFYKNADGEYVYHFQLTGDRYCPFLDDGTYKKRKDVAPIEMEVTHKKEGLKLKFMCYEHIKEVDRAFKSALQQREDQEKLKYYIDTLGKRVQAFPVRYEDVNRLLNHFLRM